MSLAGEAGAPARAARSRSSTSLSAVTMTASTSGRRSTSSIPACGPRMNTPVESPSASVAVCRDDRHAAAAARRLADVRIEEVVVAHAVLR